MFASFRIRFPSESARDSFLASGAGAGINVSSGLKFDTLWRREDRRRFWWSADRRWVRGIVCGAGNFRKVDSYRRFVDMHEGYWKQYLAAYLVQLGLGIECKQAVFVPDAYLSPTRLNLSFHLMHTSLKDGELDRKLLASPQQCVAVEDCFETELSNDEDRLPRSSNRACWFKTTGNQLDYFELGRRTWSVENSITKGWGRLDIIEPSLPQLR